MNKQKSIFLADDDEDDCLLFQDALLEVSANTQLRTANDGIELMQSLEIVVPLPDIIFLDLNMPLKNGFECLADLKRIVKFKDIPVIIFSTSAQDEAIEHVYKQGAHYYVCKPTSFDKLKTAIKLILSMNWEAHHQPVKDKFLLTF